MQVFDVGSRDPNEGLRLSDGLLNNSLVYPSIGDNFGRHAGKVLGIGLGKASEAGFLEDRADPPYLMQAC